MCFQSQNAAAEANSTPQMKIQKIAEELVKTEEAYVARLHLVDQVSKDVVHSDCDR